MTDNKVRGLLAEIFSEAQSYAGLDDLEKLVDERESLSGIPVQPLYIACKEAPVELFSSILPKLSSEQRQALSDLSLWEKDHLDIQKYEALLSAYAQCGDDQVIEEFVLSQDFHVFLKGRFGVHTFDVEDPIYPDHDYYFLTEDHQLLIEYDEDFYYVEELKFFIKKIYDILGVEKAYALIFKYISESFLPLEEEAYQLKKSRLQELGFVDYYDALEYLSIFQNKKQLERFLESKKKAEPETFQEARNQALHGRSLIGFQKLESIEKELLKVRDRYRLEYLRYHLMRFINGTLSLNNALERGNLVVAETNKQSERYLLLGYFYLMHLKKTEESLFESFDFFDCYKIGKSLLYFEKKKIKKMLSSLIFEEAKYFVFLGETIGDFLKNSLEEKENFEDFESFLSWKKKVSLYVELLPYIQKIYQKLQETIETQHLQDSYYLNYKVKEIDFEGIFLTQFLHFVLDKKQDSFNMGVSISDFKNFTQKKIESQKKVNFLSSMGVDPHLITYLNRLMEVHLGGYDFSEMKDEDFKFVGGPILLAKIGA